MLDPNLLRNELDAVAEKLARRGFKLDVDTLRQQEERRKVLQVETESLQAERNSRSKSIGAAKARGEDIEPLRLEVNELGEKLDAAKSELDQLLMISAIWRCPFLTCQMILCRSVETKTTIWKLAAGASLVRMISKFAIT